LFDPFHVLLSEAFLKPSVTFNKGPSKTSTYPRPITTPAGHILTPARLRQLGIFLSGTIDFIDTLRLKHQYTPKNSPIDVSVFTSDLLKCGNALLLVSGTTGQDGQPVIFGGWFPNPAEDQISSQPMEEEDWQGYCLFQLVPIHHVFHGIVGKPAWQLREGDMWFGEKGLGMTMTLAHNLRTATVDHTTHAVPGADCLYEATQWSGEWGESVEVEHVEIWSSDDE
jgi:hypothetical protein